MLLKYIRNYLAAHLDSFSRASILVYHYRFMLLAMNSDFIDKVMTDCIVLWQDNNSRYSVTLAYPRKDQEGDLSLEFNRCGAPLCNMSFTFVPGHVFGLPVATTLFVSRLQGAPGQLAAMREVTRDLSDVTPFAILLAAVQGISGTLRIDIAAVAARSQAVVGKIDDGATHMYRYDAMWESFGGTQRNAHIFTIPSAPCSKPLEMTSRNHRAKRVKQRAFKQSVYDHAAVIFSGYCLPGAQRASGMAGPAPQVEDPPAS